MASVERGLHGPGLEQKLFALGSQILAGRVSGRYPECQQRLIGIGRGVLELDIDWRGSAVSPYGR